jgi:hypothetical protein
LDFALDMPLVTNRFQVAQRSTATVATVDLVAQFL